MSLSAVPAKSEHDRMKTNQELKRLLFSLVMNQETLQPCLDKGVNRFLYFLPVAAVIAGHEFINCQAAVHLKVEDGFRLFKRKDAVRHEPSNIVFLMIRHFVNDPRKDGIIQEQITEHVIAVNFITERIRTVWRIAFLR